MTKTEFAFRCSAQKFLELYSPAYFWTFTFTDCMADWNYCRCFAGFSRELQDLYGGTMRGLRVMELHESHGMHYHCMLNVRVWVGHVRRIGKRYGIGIVHVQKVYSEPGAIDYLAKYLTKDSGVKFYGRCAKWGTMGGFRGTRVRDVVVESNLHTAIAHVQKCTGRRKLSLPFVNALRRETSLHGLDRMPFYGAAAVLSDWRSSQFPEVVAVLEEAKWQEENNPF